MQKNVAVKNPRSLQMTEKTHHGAPAYKTTAEMQLRRSVMACLLWEKQFYEDGNEISQRIAELVKQVRPAAVTQMAIEAREKMKLRHVPLFLIREMARHETHRPFVAEALAQVIQRGDEMAEFLAMYWEEGRVPIAHSVRKGLTKALPKFNEYSLAKYRGDKKKVTLRDVLRMIRPKPETFEQKVLWGKVVKDTLDTPDTWEVAMSMKDGLAKKEKWERLLEQDKLGALALLKNLRNMEQEGVNRNLIEFALQNMDTRRVLPFRFIAAAKHAPRFEPQLEGKMLLSVANELKLTGRTAIVVDVSGSMFNAPLSEKSDMDRSDAACGVAIVGREMFADVDIYSFSAKLVLVPARHGFALRDAIVSSQPHASTQMGAAVAEVAKNGYDRIIVITDEQAHDKVTYPAGLSKGYIINVASYKNGVGYDKWIHIDGFSEAVFSYMLETEQVNL